MSSTSKRAFTGDEGVADHLTKRMRSATPSLEGNSPSRSKKQKRQRRKKTRSIPLTSTTASPLLQPSVSRLVFAAPSSDSPSSSREISSQLDSVGITFVYSVSEFQTSQSSEDVQVAEELAHEATNSLKEEIASLKREIEDKNKIIEVKDLSASQLQQGLVCQICLDFLHKPYAAVPCGHVSCYDCLHRWFTTTLNGDAFVLGSLIARIKTCPHCRTTLANRPVEVWSMKNMVSSLVASGVATAPTSLNTPSSDSSSADAWHGIFPPITNRLPRFDGDIHDFGLLDEEDDVYRCIYCHHEIYGGRCTGCARMYNDVDGDESEPEDLGLLAPALFPFFGLDDYHDEDYESDGDTDDEELFAPSFIDNEVIRTLFQDVHSDDEVSLGRYGRGLAESEYNVFSDTSSQHSSISSDVEIVSGPHPPRQTRTRPMVMSDEEEASDGSDIEQTFEP